MAASQLSDPGISSEWLPTVEEQSRASAAARRQRFARPVAYAMLALTAFTALGVASFAWRQRTLKAALTAPPAVVSPPPAVAALPSPPSSPVSDTPVSVPAPPPVPVATPKPVAKVAPKVSKKPPVRRSPLLSSKPQPAAIKRR
jgi:hypothetical protein